jgi:hypothetical protein
MTIGLGIGLGFLKQKTSLQRFLVDLFGNNIVSLAIEAPANMSGGSITGVTNVIGPAYSYTPGSNGQYKVGSISGRVAAYDDDALGKQKSIRALTTPPVKSLWRASLQTSRTGYGTINLITNADINAGLVKAAGNSTTWLANGWTFYNNGSASNSITYNEPRLYEADLSSSVTTGVSIGGYYSDFVPRDAWPDLACFAMALSVVPTAEQRTAATYRIRLALGI